MATQTPYLDAIQAVPGDTIGEKFRWIADLIKERLSKYKKLEDIVEWEKIPKLLAPLVQIQAAMMLNKENREDQSAYGAIAEALKSDDELIVNRALQAKSFFNGTNKTITNVRYFFDNLFPYVSLNTRTRIIKCLATHLASKNPSLAEEFFTAVSTFYDLDQALPLLLACSETFMYNAIVEKRIVLSRKIVKHIFRKNPDFVVRYLRLSKPDTDPCARNLHPVNIYDFGDFLAALIKKRLDSFVELYEMHENLPPSLTLSNKCAEAFLKNGKEHLLRNPKLYIKILPLRMISNNRMEAIFLKLFPDNVKDFSTDTMLNYLEYYPQDKKVDLFLKSYKRKYGKDILEDSKKVTVSLLKLLPPEERFKQARIKLQTSEDSFFDFSYKTCWTCYLPVKESIPLFKNEISRSSEMEIRAVIATKMIYSCKVNNDEQSLLDTLIYLKNRHKNEQCWFLMKIFNTLLACYDLPQLGENYWSILTEMIVRAHVKKDLMVSDPCSVGIVEAAIHHRIIENQPIDQMIDILVDLKGMKCTGLWNILTKYPEYERTCLEACVNVLAQKYDSEKTPWKADKRRIVCDLCSSIYHFNACHVSKANRVERMSIKNYPWLMKAVEEIVDAAHQSNVYIIENLRSMLKDNEQDLYERFWPDKENVIKVENGEAFKTLRRNPESVLAHWMDYLKCCRNNWYRGHVKRFIKTIRWYKDIPIKFTEQCLQDLRQKKEESCLNILAILVHGETYNKIIEPLIPTSNVVDIYHKEAKVNYSLVQHVVYGINLANPPVSLTLVRRLCEGDYLSVALATLISICRRTNLMDVVSFARTLTSQRISVRKHGIRLMYLLAPRNQLIDFLHAEWKVAENHSIRKVIFSMAKQLFQNGPGPATWSLFSNVIDTLTDKDESSLTESLVLISTTPDEYVVDLIKLALSTIDKFNEAGTSEGLVTNSINTLLSNIKAAICNLLPEDLIKDLIRRFLFHHESIVSRNAAMFVLTALLHPAKEKFDDRMKIFSDVFTEAVKTSWNVSHEKNPQFYPVNHAVHHFVDVVLHTFCFLELEPRLIDGILSTFSSALQPQMDATSYLFLTYLQEYVRVKTPEEFGERLGRKMTELSNIFSPLFILHMADTLQTMLEVNTFKVYEKDDASLGVIEGFMKIGSMEATLMAAKLLSYTKSKEYTERYENLTRKLLEYDHPVTKSIVYDILNRRSFKD